MVFTVEPGIYIPAEGFGIRLEDDVVIWNRRTSTDAQHPNWSRRNWELNEQIKVHTYNQQSSAI
jgi:Xaa-Pro aminopeptidase